MNDDPKASIPLEQETRMKSGNWPEISSDPLYQLLHNEEIDKFNIQRKTLDTSHLKAKNYRGLDLRDRHGITQVVVDAPHKDLRRARSALTSAVGRRFREGARLKAPFSKVSVCRREGSVVAADEHVVIAAVDGRRIDHAG